MGDVDEDTGDLPAPRLLVPVPEGMRPRSRVNRELRGLEQGLANVNRRVTSIGVTLGFWSDDRAEDVANLVRDVSRAWYVVLSVAFLILGVSLETLAFFVQD